MFSPDSRPSLFGTLLLSVDRGAVPVIHVILNQAVFLVVIIFGDGSGSS